MQQIAMKDLASVVNHAEPVKSSKVLHFKDLSDSCSIFLYTEGSRPERRIADDYLALHLGYPDPGSKFDQNIGFLKYLIRKPLSGFTLPIFMNFLHAHGYDILMLNHPEDYIIGHTAFQRHGEDLHVFAIGVDDEFRRNGLATYMQEEVIRKAREKRIQRIRLGAGGNEIVDKIYKKLCQREDVIPEPGYWLRIR